VSFPPYAEYKDSGVAWLGAVPEHWELTRIGARFVERREKVSDIDYPPLSVTKNGIVPQLETAAKTDDNDNRKCVLAGDFVINSRSDRKGSSGLSELDGSVSLINTVIRPDDGMHGRFVHHLFRSVAFQEEYYRYGKGIVADLWSTNYGEMKAITLAPPPLAEQKAIAGFLDREVGKIDDLVAEQERLIALLKEKRQAVISHTVTKGLNPNAPLKDSGIAWLGQIPAHWEVASLRWYVTCNSGHSFDTASLSTDRLDGFEVPVFGGNGLMGYTNVGNVNDSALVIGRVGALCGNVHVAPNVVWVTDNALVLRVTKPELSHLYLAWVLMARRLNDLAAKTAQPLITGSQVLDQRSPRPPLGEQMEILSFLESRLSAFDALTAEAQSAITLLTERRAALISAAVTGKIDVRAANASAKPSAEMENA